MAERPRESGEVTHREQLKRREESISLPSSHMLSVELLSKYLGDRNVKVENKLLRVYANRFDPATNTVPLLFDGDFSAEMIEAVRLDILTLAREGKLPEKVS